MHKRLSFILALELAVATALGIAGSCGPRALPEGFVPLFNGKDLTNWHGLKTMDPRNSNL